MRRVDGAVLWANLALLFCLSLLPFTTAWMDESSYASPPTMTYGANLLLCALAWFVMQRAVFRSDGPDSLLRRAIGQDTKAKMSPVLYVVGIAAAGWLPWVGLALFTVVAVMWLVPDRRIERFVTEAAGAAPPA